MFSKPYASRFAFRQRIATEASFQKRSNGFSLIELMIVVVIIGIVSGATLFAFGDFGTSRKTKAAAEQLAGTIKLVQQQAILEASTFGIMIDKQGYQVLHLDQSSHWTPVKNNHFFNGQRFPTTIVIENSAAPQKKSKQIIPDIVINGTGEVSNFQLNLGTANNPQSMQLIGKNHGQIDFKTT